jgi:Flp pilus assembly protein TadG
MIMTRGLRLKSRKGGAAVELAVLFPVILLILIGIVDYGRVFYTWVQVSNAARAGAEWGGQSFVYETATDSMTALAKVDGADAGTLTPVASYFCECGGIANATCTLCAGGAAPEVYTKVVISKTVNMFLAYPGLPATVTISRTAYFRSQ